MPILIHDKQYVTVAERLTEARDQIQEITTEVLYTTPMIVVKATVLLQDGKVFTGISGANTNKTIEKMSPFEVAETSAVGRALGFAGYGATDSIASAEEMKKAEAEEKVIGTTYSGTGIKTTYTANTQTVEVTDADLEAEAKRHGNCKNCGAPKRVAKTGNIVCSEACWANKKPAYTGN